MPNHRESSAAPTEIAASGSPARVKLAPETAIVPPPHDHPRQPGARRRSWGERLTAWGTAIGAICGIAALAWQVVEGRRSRLELLRAEVLRPEVATDGRLRLRVAVTNDSDRPAYVRLLQFLPDTSGLSPTGIGNLTVGEANLTFVRDTSVKLESGDAASFKSPPMDVLRAVAMDHTYLVGIRTTRKEYRFRVVPFSPTYTRELLTLDRQGYAPDSSAYHRFVSRAGAECDSLKKSPLFQFDLRLRRVGEVVLSAPKQPTPLSPGESFCVFLDVHRGLRELMSPGR